MLRVEIPYPPRSRGDELVYGGVDWERFRTRVTDVDVCFFGNIGITQLQI